MFFNNNKCCCQNNWQGGNACCNQDPCGCDPVIEQPIERCIERNICHRVEQD